MNQNPKIDLFCFFDKIQEPFILFNQEDSIRYNSFSRYYFDKCPDDWRQFFVDDEIQKVINDFFDKVELPKIEIILNTENNFGKQVTIEWEIQRVTFNMNENCLLGKGKIISTEDSASIPIENVEKEENVLSELGDFYATTFSNHLLKKKLLTKENLLSLTEILTQVNDRILATNIPMTNVFLIDKDLKYVAAEGANFADWGMTSMDFVGKTLEEMHKYNLHEIKPAVLKAINNKAFVHKILVFRKRVYEMTVRPIAYNGGVDYALGILRDINEEYEAKENLKASEEKYRTLVEESTEIIFSLTTNLVLTYVSPNVKQFLGYDYQEVTHSKLTDYLHPEDLIVFLQIMEESSSNVLENHQYLEYRLKHKNGEYRVFSSNGRLLRDELGNVRHYIGVARDITKLKEDQRELFSAKEKAEQASMIKSQFLSIMSHEIRTPMNAVIGMAHLLMEENPRPDQLENLKTLQFSAENLLGLINDILDFNKIESGKIDLDNVAFDINVVFNRIIHSYTFQAREKKLEVSFDIDSSIPKVLMGDPVRLSQVANNLVSNAIKFTEKGFVKIQLKKVFENKKIVKIRFEFKDSGIGIAEEKLQSIFDAFTQASTETTRKYGGTGLGLAIVKKLVELFGGEIMVSSVPSGGSEFSFEIEFNKLRVNYFENKIDHVKIEMNLSHASILVAEDNFVNQIMIKKFLNKWGVKEIVMTNDGYEAIEAIDTQDFDLILLDLQMPEKDGFEVGEYIRSHSDDKIRSMPIIALTASSLIEVKDQLDAIGVNDYISKPFNPDNLYAKIIRYINV